MYPTSVYP